MSPSLLKVKSASLKSFRLLSVQNHSLHSFIVPVASMAPTKAPIELPMMEVNSNPRFSSSSMAPI